MEAGMVVVEVWSHEESWGDCRAGKAFSLDDVGLIPFMIS